MAPEHLVRQHVSSKRTMADQQNDNQMVTTNVFTVQSRLGGQTRDNAKVRFCDLLPTLDPSVLQQKPRICPDGAGPAA
jgi:hypothetical protein